MDRRIGESYLNVNLNDRFIFSGLFGFYVWDQLFYAKFIAG